MGETPNQPSRWSKYVIGNPNIRGFSRSCGSCEVAIPQMICDKKRRKNRSNY